MQRCLLAGPIGRLGGFVVCAARVFWRCYGLSTYCNFDKCNRNSSTRLKRV